MRAIRFRHTRHTLAAAVALAAGLLGCGGATGPTQALTLTFAAVSAGGEHTCRLATGGTAYCWGYNFYGQLGNGTMTDRSSPVLVAASVGVRFAAVTAGFLHTCGVTAAGTAYCWGMNLHGELGTSLTSETCSLVDPCSTTPVAVAGDVSFAAVTAGSHHTCGVTTGGVAYCWGWNVGGQLGDGTTTNRFTPVLVAAPAGVSFAAVTTGSHTCGVTAAGAAYCWGGNGSGQLGDGTTTSTSTPVLVAGGLSFAALSAGGSHTCGLTAAGAGYCWGFNGFGQLGDGTTADRVIPVLVVAPAGVSFAAISAGFNHTCGVTAAGAAYCWGNNVSGQLGDGTMTDRVTPVLVAAPAGVRFTAVSAGGEGDVNQSCGVAAPGFAYCWGSNEQGQLGDGTMIDRLTPVRVVQ